MLMICNELFILLSHVTFFCKVYFIPSYLRHVILRHPLNWFPLTAVDFIRVVVAVFVSVARPSRVDALARSALELVLAARMLGRTLKKYVKTMDYARDTLRLFIEGKKVSIE